MTPQTANDKLYDYFHREKAERQWPKPDADIAAKIRGISKQDVYNYRRSMHIPGVDIRRENIWKDAEAKLQSLNAKSAYLLNARRRDTVCYMLASFVLFVLFVLALIF